jgi:hypothetical protein
MTKKLENLFDLADHDTPAITVEENLSITNGDTVVLEKQTLPEIQNTLAAVDKIDAALPTIRDLETSDNELDDIASTARKTFDDLMDLGMNVEARFSGEIFNNASRMLDTALTAKTNKINKKLKMVELQLKKAAHDFKTKEEDTNTVAADGQGVIMDRTALLNEILGKKA